MARLLIVRPYGGLCNRLRALLSAAALARATQRRFAYTWVTTPSFAPRFTDLYEDPFRELPSRAVSVLARATGGYTPQADVNFASTRRLVMTNGNEVFCKGDSRLEHWTREMLALRVRTDIRARAERVFERDLAGHPTVGVMIRAYGDAHDETRAASPVSWFVARLAEVRAAHPEARVFLSTDDPAASTALRDEIGDIVELPGKGAYNSLEGVRDALADLYLLATTNYLIGSHWSSFSDTASDLAQTGAYETSRRVPTLSIGDALACTPRHLTDLLDPSEVPRIVS